MRVLAQLHKEHKEISLIRYGRFKLHAPMSEYGRAGHAALLLTTMSADVLAVPGEVASVGKEFRR